MALTCRAELPKSVPAQRKAIQAAAHHHARKSIQTAGARHPQGGRDIYELDKSQKLSELARVYEVPYSRLWNRIKGRVSRSDRPASNRLFKDEQENPLKTWIKFLDDIGVPPTIKLLRYHGCLIIQHQSPIGETPHLVGENWPYRCLRGLPEQC